MDEKQLQEIEARIEKATPGPWRYDPNAFYEIDGPGEYSGIAQLAYGRYEVEDYANGKFIAHARQDVPDLVAELRRLQAERDELRAALIRLGEGAYQSEIVDTGMEESERANPYFDKDEWINDWIAEQIELEGPGFLNEWPYNRALRAGQQAESGGGE
jgi:hypothetical protein